MVAAVQDLAKEPNQDCAAPVASFLEACNLIFENGLLSRRRINSLQSPVIQNIQKGMDFFEKWCHSHEETGILRLYISELVKTFRSWKQTFFSWRCSKLLCKSLAYMYTCMLSVYQ